MTLLPNIYPATPPPVPAVDSLVSHILPLLQRWFGKSFASTIEALNCRNDRPSFEQIVDTMSKKLAMMIESNEYRIIQDSLTNANMAYPTITSVDHADWFGASGPLVNDDGNQEGQDSAYVTSAANKRQKAKVRKAENPKVPKSKKLEFRKIVRTFRIP